VPAAKYGNMEKTDDSRQSMETKKSVMMAVIAFRLLLLDPKGSKEEQK
jgi:hypothetical protein